MHLPYRANGIASEGKPIPDINTNINTDVKDKYSAEIAEIVDYLNQKAGTKYRANSESNKKHIKARLKEGFPVDDFKTVIDKKCSEWIGTQFEKFLRPETLFGSKFESYLNANVNPVSDNGAQRLPTDEDYMGEGVF